MRTVAAVLTLAAVAAVQADAACQRQGARGPELIRTPRSHEVVDMASLPTNFDWGAAPNSVGKITNFLSESRNQHRPHYCGSCWAHSAASVLSDRLRIQHDGVWPMVDLAPQVLLDCDSQDNGCHGGDYYTAFEYVHSQNITDETCAIYAAEGHDTGRTCTSSSVCKTCSPSGGCAPVPKGQYVEVGVSEYGYCNGEAKMMAEIYARGPISVGIAVTSALEAWKLPAAKGVFVDKTGATQIEHAVAVTGWGVEASTGQKYWIVRNSWGTFWGDHGYFKLLRGVNNLAVESDAVFAVPLPPSFPITPVPANLSTRPALRGAEQPAAALPDRTGMYMDYANPTKITHSKQSVVTQPLPHTQIAASNLPAEWDWRNVNGTSYVSWAVNQHIPVYCGSCWSQGTTFAISSRIAIARKAAFPVVSLSPQVVVNYAQCGDCQGGDPMCALGFMHNIGIPDQTCQQYVAENGKYDSMGICETCAPNATSFWPGTCAAVSDYVNWKIGDYSSIEAFNVDHIKAEIMSRGPVSAGVEVVASFENYSPANGIYNNVNDFPAINHEVALVGWFTEASTGKEAWILRNSWGTAWGVDGMMYCYIGGCAGVEASVSWGVPIVPNGF